LKWKLYLIFFKGIYGNNRILIPNVTAWSKYYSTGDNLISSCQWYIFLLYFKIEILRNYK